MPITIYSCAHDPDELTPEFERLLNDCDILVLEQGYKEFYKSALKHYNDLSFKGYSNHQPIDSHFPKFGEKLESLIRNSKKRIEVEKSPVSALHLSELKDLDEAKFLEFYDGNLEEACKFSLMSASLSVELTTRRDLALTDQLTSLQEENEEYEILVLLGANHEAYHMLKRKELKVRRVFPFMPYVFLSFEELERRMYHGLPWSKDLVARAFPERITYYLLGYPHYERVRIARDVGEKLKYEDVRAISKFISTGQQRIDPDFFCILWLEKNLKLKLRMWP